MVATVLRLKLRLLANTMQREVWRVILVVLGALWALSMVPGVVGGARWLAFQPLEVRSSALVVVGTVLLVGWTVIPVLMFGADETVTPRKFAVLGPDPRRLALRGRFRPRSRRDAENPRRFAVKESASAICRPGRAGPLSLRCPIPTRSDRAGSGDRTRPARSRKSGATA